MTKYFVLVFIMAGISAFACDRSFVSSLRDTTDTEENTTNNGFALIKDSLSKAFATIKKQSDDHINRLQDSLLIQTFKDVDSVFPASERKSLKAYSAVISAKESNLKLFIINSTDSLKISQRAVVDEFFKAITDSTLDTDLSAEIADSLDSAFDENAETIADSASSLLEAFGDYIDDVQQAELDKPAEVKIGLTADSHNHINMRDDGRQQFVAAPSISFTLPFGFSAGASIGYYSGESTKWDGATQYINYDLLLGKNTFYVTYSHFNYNSTSTKRKASFNNAIATGINYEGEKLYFAGRFDFYLAKVKEPAFFIEGGRPFLLTGEDAAYAISVMPELSICWGVQDTGITALRLKKLPPPKKAASKTLLKITATPKAKAKASASNFSVLGYEFSVPVEYVYKRISLKLTPDYVIPVNVSDGSTSSPFVSVSLEMEYGFNIFR